MNPSADELLHIASFVVQHRLEAVAALARAVAASPGVELVRSAGTRSIVICETADQHALIDRIEALRGVAGVLNVALVYHHAEPRAELDAELAPRTGARP